jgi:hypothetical protein
MNHQKQKLVSTTIRLPLEALALLDEASSLQQLTRADLIRNSIRDTLDHWKTVGRRQVADQLLKTIDTPEHQCIARI